MMLGILHDGGPWLLALANLAALIWGGTKVNQLHLIINSRLDEILKGKQETADARVSEADALGEKRGIAIGVAQQKEETK
jgi:hypothetical protein